MTGDFPPGVVMINPSQDAADKDIGRSAHSLVDVIEQRIRNYPPDGVEEHGIFPTYGDLLVLESTGRGRKGWEEWWKQNRPKGWREPEVRNG